MNNEIYAASSTSNYSPTAFTISFVGKILQTIPPEQEDVPEFMHEYVHFIQDTNTAFGGFDFLQFIDFFEAIAVHISNQASHDSFAPVVNDPMRDQTIDEIQKLRSLSYPREIWQEVKRFTGKLCINNQQYSSNGQTSEWPELYGEYTDRHNNSFLHVIGPWEIKEAYAISIENRFRKQSGVAEHTYLGSQYEYFCVKDVLRNRFDNITNESAAIICHWALQTIYTGPRLLEIINGLQYKFGRTLPLDDILSAFLKRSHADSSHKYFSSEMIQLLENRIKITPKINRGYIELLTWHLRLVKPRLKRINSCLYRFPEKTALLSGYDISKILKQQPVSVCINASNGEAYSFGRKKENEWYPFIFYCMKILSHYFFAKGKNSNPIFCPLFATCRDAPKEKKFTFFDESICASNPWNNAKQKCPFGVACTFLSIQ